MRSTITALQMGIRVVGVVQLGLGLLGLAERLATGAKARLAPVA